MAVNVLSMTTQVTMFIKTDMFISYVKQVKLTVS